MLHSFLILLQLVGMYVSNRQNRIKTFLNHRMQKLFASTNKGLLLSIIVSFSDILVFKSSRNITLLYLPCIALPCSFVLCSGTIVLLFYYSLQNCYHYYYYHPWISSFLSILDVKLMKNETTHTADFFNR